MLSTLRLNALTHWHISGSVCKGRGENELKAARQQADTHQAPLHSTTSKRRSRSRERRRGAGSEHRSRSHDHHPDAASTRHGWESRSRDQRHEARVSRSRSRGHRCKDISEHRSRSRAHHRDVATIVHFRGSPNREQRCEGTVGQTLYGPFAKNKRKFGFIEQDSGEA